jgi:arylsulfatase A-like enzyme
VPDWLPPSIAVRKGDWKLIRVFHGGEEGAHWHLLYNLAEDIGEENDVAAANPEKVAELSQLIDDFLRETEGVLPLPNPNFDPAKYRPERIGVGRNRAAKKARKK